MSAGVKRRALIFGFIMASLLITFAILEAKEHRKEDLQIRESIKIQHFEIDKEIMEEHERAAVLPAESKTIVGEPVSKQTFRACEDIPLSEDEQFTLYHLCREQGVPMAYALAIIDTESRFDREAEGTLGEVGLFQVHPVNWSRMEEEHIDVFDTKGNLEAGVIILAECFNQYHELDKATMAYKCGQTRAAELIEQGIRLNVCDEVAELTMYYEGLLNED